MTIPTLICWQLLSQYFLALSMTVSCCRCSSLFGTSPADLLTLFNTTAASFRQQQHKFAEVSRKGKTVSFAYVFEEVFNQQICFAQTNQQKFFSVAKTKTKVAGFCLVCNQNSFKLKKVILLFFCLCVHFFVFSEIPVVLSNSETEFT